VDTGSREENASKQKTYQVWRRRQQQFRKARQRAAAPAMDSAPAA
jgi:hypothetical protein